MIDPPYSSGSRYIAAMVAPEHPMRGPDRAA